MARFSRPSNFCVCLLLTTFNSISLTVAQCYLPGGALAEDHIPCDPFAFTTVCCPTGWTCFSNNLCVATDSSVMNEVVTTGTSYRGACTNPEWNDTACGNFCLDNPQSDNSGEMVSCGNNKYCCRTDAVAGRCDCQSGNGLVEIPEGVAQTIIGIDSMAQTATVDSSSASVSASTLSSASQTTASSSDRSTRSQSSNTITQSTISPKSRSTSLSTATQTGSTTTNRLASSTASTVPSSSLLPSSPSSSRLSTGAKAGIAVGAICAALIILALLILLLRSRRALARRRESRQSRRSSGAIREHHALPPWWAVVPWHWSRYRRAAREYRRQPEMAGGATPRTEKHQSLQQQQREPLVSHGANYMRNEEMSQHDGYQTLGGPYAAAPDRENHPAFRNPPPTLPSRNSRRMSIPRKPVPYTRIR